MFQLWDSLVPMAKSLKTIDEPTGNLDSKTGAEIMKLLQSINKNSGQTIIMVTHSPEAAKNSNRIITVKDGMIE